MTTDPVTGRDSETGELVYKVGIDIRIIGQTLPTMISCPDWDTAADYLRSIEFRRIAKKVSFLTINNRAN